MIRHAYDLQMGPAAHDAGRREFGWVFGLPPGLVQAQWPLDPVSGYPLMHGFTLRLPDDYRCHGPDIVAVSFFATAPDQNQGGATEEPAMAAAVLDATAPVDPRYRPFWRASADRHPRLHRMTDLIGNHYAVILLTASEYDGPLCQPPDPPRIDLAMDRQRRRIGGTQRRDGTIDWEYGPTTPRPAWLAAGSLPTWSRSADGTMGSGDDQIGPLPEGLAACRPVTWTPRPSDRNAGRKPRDYWSPDTAGSGYVPDFYFDDQNTYHTHAWAQDFARNHIGGTMKPTQAVPDMSPYYIEFDEDFGGYNFGGDGNAQLDVQSLTFSWACG